MDNPTQRDDDWGYPHFIKPPYESIHINSLVRTCSKPLSSAQQKGNSSDFQAEISTVKCSAKGWSTWARFSTWWWMLMWGKDGNTVGWMVNHGKTCSNVFRYVQIPLETTTLSWTNSEARSMIPFWSVSAEMVPGSEDATATKEFSNKQQGDAEDIVQAANAGTSSTQPGKLQIH